MIKNDTTLAVIDLGSNSFHMIVAELNADRSLHVIDRIKERVRLAEGMGKEKLLHPAARRRALYQLKQFKERLSEFENETIRVVGTDTFRKARNGQSFLKEATHALGRPISIISGLFICFFFVFVVILSTALLNIVNSHSWNVIFLVQDIIYIIRIKYIIIIKIESKIIDYNI